MAAVTAKYECTNTNLSVHLKPKRLPREKLQSIACALEVIVQEFGFNYQAVTDDELPTLQEYCFKLIFDMCERNEMDSIHMVKDVIQGLTDSSGHTILSRYVQKEDLEKIKNIVNAKLERILSKGETPLHVAMRLGRSLYSVKLLKGAGCGTPEDRDYKGRLPVHIAAKNDRSYAIEELMPKAQGVVVPNIYYYSNKHKINLTPLALAVFTGQISVFIEIKKVGQICLAAVRAGGEKMTLLHLAIHANQFEILKYLLIEHFEDIKSVLDVADENGCTPTILAAGLGDEAALTLLLDKGANIESRDLKGRTAVHHAVMKRQIPALCILAGYGAKLQPIDLDEKMPTDLLGVEDIAFKKAITNFINDWDYKRKTYPVNFALHHPENLVFKGGGPKGVAYLGAIKVLQARGLLANVKRFAGTSAGAITAALLSVSCNAEEAENLLIQTAGTYFFDHPFTDERLEELVKDNLNVKVLKEAYDVISECIASGSASPAFKAAGLKLANAIWKCTGVCEGRRFLIWIENEIAQRTGIPYCTFGELADLIARGKKNPQGRPFRHLHIYATKLGASTEIVRFSTEDPKYRNLVISEAVRASISIPVVFKPHILIFKRKLENGEYEFYTHNETQTSLDYDKLKEHLRLGTHIAESSYVDGGLIYNFPISAFDRRGYTHYGVPEEEKGYYQFNRRTLGFSLNSVKEDRDKVHEVKSVENIGQLLMGVYSVFRHAETILDKADSDPRDKERIVALDNQGISLLSFSTTPMLGKGAKASDAAEKITNEFLDKQEEKVKALADKSTNSPQVRPSTLVPRHDMHVEMHITEEEAKKILTLGPNALKSISLNRACKGADQAISTFLSIFVITLPLTVPTLVFLSDERKSTKSRKFELLALDDPRFNLFEYISQGEYEAAYGEFMEHQGFFRSIMKTYVFVSALKKCLQRCDNDYYRVSEYDDHERFRRYMYFFTQTQIIPSIIPRSFVYDLPEL